MNVEGPRMGVIFGIMLIVAGILSIMTGDGGHAFGIFGKVSVVDWIGWIFLPAGIYICFLSVRALRRGEGKPKSYTDEDAVRAKERLDRMHLREHGSLPEDMPREEKMHWLSLPEEAKSETAQPEEPACKKVQAKSASVRPAFAFMSNANIRQGLLAVLAGGALFFAGNLFSLILGAALFFFGLCRLVRGIMEVV